MEILRGQASSVRFSVPEALTYATATVTKNGDVSADISVTPTAGVASVPIPYSKCIDEGTIDITLSFTFDGESVVLSKSVYVATPILEPFEIKEICSDATPAEIVEIEAAVRHIIQAHTGQSFGKYTGPISVTGSGDSNLRMPRRLISYTGINGSSYWNSLLSLRGGGWFLQSKYAAAPPSVRADFDGWHYSSQTPIVAPYSKVLTTFTKNVEYVIDGVWGWEEVPEAVREAARLLVNDYSCADSLYRDRFLTSMTAADWRIQFHDGAFSNTGNVRANQLLAEFVLRRGWVVI